MQSHENNFNMMRLLAAMQVMIVHGCNHFHYDGLFTSILKIVPGVPVFFFISGYVIFLACQRAENGGWFAYFRNRFLRIFPALWFCVLGATGVVFSTGYFHEIDIDFAEVAIWLAAQGSILQFYNPDFMRGYGDGVLNGALWTISVELQFYVLAPILYLLTKRAPWVLVLVALTSIAVNLCVVRFTSDALLMKLVYVSFAPWVYMFIAGFAAARWLRRTPAFDNIPYLGIITLYVASMFIGGYEQNAQNSINPIAFAILAVLILKAAHDLTIISPAWRRRTNEVDISYGVYLFHMPVINTLIHLGLNAPAVDLIAVFTISILLSLASWFWIEKPSLDLKKLLSRRRVAPSLS